MLTRRYIVASLLAALVAACAKSDTGERKGATAMSSDNSSNSAKNVVLVHGAWADGSSWMGVIPLLQAAGMKVTAVQIPLTSLADDVAATRRALSRQNGSTVLVGHSYGGNVITEAGNDPKVTSLVYVAALAPEPGEDFTALAGRFPTPQGGAHIKARDGFAVLDEVGVTENFAQDLPIAQAKVLASVQGPIAETLFADKTTVAAWRDKPSWYAVSEADRMIAPELERFLAKRMDATTIELPTSHASPVTRPREIADLIIAATQVRAR